MAGTSSYQDGPSERYPVRDLANSMQSLSDSVGCSTNSHIKVLQFAQMFRLLPITGFGQQFEFVYKELINKVERVEVDSKDENETIEELFNKEIEQGSAKISYGRSRNVIRLMRVIDLVRILFDKILTNERSESLYAPVSMAYDEVFGPYHFPSAKDAVHAALQQFLPTMSTFLNALNETEDSIKEPFQRFIEAGKVVTLHIKSVFSSNELGDDLLELI